jgi:hypothetical protein
MLSYVEPHQMWVLAAREFDLPDCIILQRCVYCAALDHEVVRANPHTNVRF